MTSGLSGPRPTASSSDVAADTERSETENEFFLAQAIRARVQAQLDDKEVRVKLHLADTVITILDYRWLLSAVFLGFLGFVFWLGLNAGRSG